MDVTHTGLRGRFATLIQARLPEDRRFKRLEEESGIGVDSWRKAFNGDQRPTAEMLEVVAHLWPEHVVWLMTGLTDNKSGQQAPDRSAVMDAPFVHLPNTLEYQRLRAERMRLLEPEHISLAEKFNDKLTKMQERNSERWTLAQVHPSLAQRKAAKAKADAARALRIAELELQIEEARLRRDDEVKALYVSEEG